MIDATILARARAWLAPKPPEPIPLVDALAVAAALCRRFEGFFPAPYLCPAGVATIGFGTTRYRNGHAVTLKDLPISREVAEGLLLHQLQRDYLPEVMRLCPGITNPLRLAALIDFTYNLGAGNLRASTLRKRVNAGSWDAVPVELQKWVRGGGKVLRGLVIRRKAESDLI